MPKGTACPCQGGGRRCRLVVFSELFICGYPPEDLVLKPALQVACRSAVEALAAETADGGPAMLIGTPWVEDRQALQCRGFARRRPGRRLRFKVDLPNYGVFDEKRVFAPGPMPGPVNFRGVRLGVPICEDIWGPEPSNASARPAAKFCGAQRLALPPRRDRRAAQRGGGAGQGRRLPLVYVNQVGGQDELVFEGASFVLNADLTFGAQLPSFREAVATVVFERAADGWHCIGGPTAPQESGDEADYAACVLGCATMWTRTVFPASSSAVRRRQFGACAAISVDALGAGRVRCVMLPYRFTSQQSLDDAAQIATALGVHYDIVPIASAIGGLEKALAPLMAGLQRDVTEENLQARARGTMLMAVSNKFGLMVVTTGNKSEMSAAMRRSTAT